MSRYSLDTIQSPTVLVKSSNLPKSLGQVRSHFSPKIPCLSKSYWGMHFGTNWWILQQKMYKCNSQQVTTKCIYKLPCFRVNDHFWVFVHQLGGKLSLFWDKLSLPPSLCGNVRILFLKSHIFWTEVLLLTVPKKTKARILLSWVGGT